MLAALSRRRSRVQIPFRTLTDSEWAIAQPVFISLASQMRLGTSDKHGHVDQQAESTVSKAAESRFNSGRGY